MNDQSKDINILAANKLKEDVFKLIKDFETKTGILVSNISMFRHYENHVTDYDGTKLDISFMFRVE